MKTNFDFIIVGGGTAGLIVATRLVETGKYSVLLVEAGDIRSSPYLRIPLAVGKVLSNEKYVWPYTSGPEPYLKNRRLYTPMGKLLGGSSAVNGTVFAWGPKEKYDEWESLGCKGFAWKDVEPYFHAIENFCEPSNLRGSHGPIHISNANISDKLSQLFLESSKTAGYPFIKDYNTDSSEGVSALQYSTKNGLRQSTNNTYFKLAKRNKNFHVITGATVEQLQFIGTRVTGCKIHNKYGKKQIVTANCEMVICCGAIQTPALLQRSGIGDQSHLRKLGLQHIIHLPNVGVGLQDHANTRLTYKVGSVKTLNDYLNNPLLFAKYFLSYAIKRQNLLATPSATAHLLLKSETKIAYPDLKLQLVHMSESQRFGMGKQTSLDRTSGFSIGTYYLYPKSAGTVKIKSVDPKISPSIIVNYLADDVDRRKSVLALNLARKVVSESPLKEFVQMETNPTLTKVSDQELLDYVLENCQSGYHYACSCRMGSGKSAVVDDKFKVIGLENLRLCDASVMPFLTSSNTQAVVMMMGEKAAAEIIRQYN
ncbi:GMC family oxidoreductase N-terminal domain-containing protein [Alphaproteobacteria bacterium]|nr:GMC family oxidoreductase N-terminal domain-containing protein [Alphaproteobacteria bacterium]